jgi:hypothetical protein
MRQLPLVKAQALPEENAVATPQESPKHAGYLREAETLLHGAIPLQVALISSHDVGRAALSESLFVPLAQA